MVVFYYAYLLYQKKIMFQTNAENFSAKYTLQDII